MRVFSIFALFFATAWATKPGTAGIQGLLQRRMPRHTNQFIFKLTEQSNSSAVVNVTGALNDQFTVSNGHGGTIAISGNKPSALAYGLRWYLTNYLNVDIYWFLGSTLELAPRKLPSVNRTYTGTSTVPWRYHFNTVTFSYTAAFWDWDDWQLQLDWMALHGVNIPLAWVGYEGTLSEVLLEYGFSQSAISAFLAGPAFQAWNRFGNIQGSWGGQLPSGWITGQTTLQKKIVSRMVELGMTPVLPAFTGFVPTEIASLYPNASFVNGSQWSGFPSQYTNVTFLEPFDPLYAQMQKSFIQKQKAAYGNVTNLYTLDQYNENDPYSGDLGYLNNVTKNTIAALKGADEDAIWMLQGWLFYSAESFWTNDRVEAYLGGVNNSEMLIIDLFSESAPQWQRTDSYYGKPWLWCELHDYGGNMGLYGQLDNVTINPVEALRNSTSTMVGMGLTMEGQEGNQIMYDILLDQAWSKVPIDTEKYFINWVSTRYHASPMLPSSLYSAWNILRETVYNNLDFSLSIAVTKSIFELSPNTTGLLNRTGHHATVITYDPSLLVQAWKGFYNATKQDSSLWKNEAFVFDFTDVTRQVMANAFDPIYSQFVSLTNASSLDNAHSNATKTGQKAIRLLHDLDFVLRASRQSHFLLPSWIEDARALAKSHQSEAGFYEYNARNQITLWGPAGEINDYASKQWAGLISSYYIPRWQLFFEYTLNSTTSSTGVNPALSSALLRFEEAWQTQSAGDSLSQSPSFPKAIARVVRNWPDVFNS